MVADSQAIVSMNYARVSHSACYGRNALIVSGSWKEESISTVEYLNLNPNELSIEWQKLPNLKQGRFDHSSCVLGDHFFAFCGFSRHLTKYLASIEVLDLSAQSKAFTTLQSTTTLSARCSPGLIVLEDNRILVLGGTGDRNVEIHDCHVLDTNSKQITQMELPV